VVVKEDNLQSQSSSAIVRRNVTFTAVNHFLINLAMNLSDSNMVLPLFVKALGGSNLLAGLLPSLRFVGWLAPQYFVAGRMRRLSHFLPMALLLEAIRSSFYLVIAGLTLTHAIENPGLVLAVFLLLYLVTRLSAGSSNVARSEIIARMVPPQQRASVIALRSFAGGVGGFVAGFGVRWILDERMRGFPHNYATLIGLSGVCFGLALGALGAIKEPTLPIKPSGIDLLEQIKRAPRLLKSDRRYFRYILVRAASTGLQLATPFYIIYAAEVLGAPTAWAGVYISIQTFSRLLSNLLWGGLSRKRGSLWILRTACALGILAPATAVLFSWAAPLIISTQAPGLAMWLFGCVFLLQGLAHSAKYVGQMAYLFDIAPEKDRPVYYGLSNTILGPLYFLPALGGVLLDVAGFATVFATSAIFMVLAYVLATRLGCEGTVLEVSALQGPTTE